MPLFLPADATFRRLTWNDFTTKNVPAPPPGGFASAAFTSVGHRLNPNTFTFAAAEYLKPRMYKMVEDPDVVVVINTSQMWVASWLFSKSKAEQDSVLAHEQGHYEISMLAASDIFSSLCGIQGGAFATAQAGVNAMNQMNRTLGNYQNIHNKYDRDTRHGQITAMQTAWNNALSQARVTFERPALRVALKNAGLFP